MGTLIQFAHLCSLVVWLGAVAFFSFVVTPALFHALPKEMTSKALNALFPQYYFLGYVCGAIALLTHVILWVGGSGGMLLFALKLCVLGGMVFFTYYAGMIVYPEVHHLALEMNQQGEENAPPELREQFGKMHRLSVLINLLILVLGLFLLWFWVLGTKS